jgi:hypothetical protein
VSLEDMGWTAEEAAAMRNIDPALRDRILNALNDIEEESK